MTRTDRLRKFFIGMAMSTVLLAQAVVSFGPMAGAYTYRKFWPWLMYPMYSVKRVEGQVVEVEGIIYAITQSGERVEVTGEMLDFGGNIFRALNLYRRLSKSEPVRQEDVQYVANAIGGRKLIAIETFYYPLIIEKEGAVEVEATLRRRIDLD